MRKLNYTLLSVGLALSGGHLTSALAQSNEPIQFTIQTTSLEDALSAYAAQTGISVSYQPEILAGLKSTALSLTLTPETALQQLLAGKRLEYEFTSDKTVTIKRQVSQAGPIRLQPINIKGELIQRTEQETQSSVNTISQDFIDNNNITDLGEVFRRTPGITSAANGSGFSIRGIPDRGLGSGLGDTSQSAAIYIDGAVQSVLGGANGILNTWDVQQVEVYRGPVTIAQGRSAIAGGVVVRTNDPEYDWSARGRVSAGNDATRQYAIAFGGPLIDETLAFRISADRTETDGFVSFVDGDTRIDDIGRDNRDVVRGKLLFEPTDSFSALLTVSHSDAERGSDLVTGMEPLQGIRTTVVDITNTEVTSTVLELTYVASEQWSYKAISTVTDLENRFAPLAGTQLAAGVSTTGLAEDKNVTQELRALYDNGKHLRATVGMYYADISEESSRTISGSQGPLSIVRDDGYDNNFENFALFGELEYELSEKWTVIAGGRFDREDGNRREFAITDITPDIPELPDGETNFSGDSSFDAFLPKLSLVHNIEQDISLSFTMQRAYRPGGVDIRPDTNESLEFDPEFSWNYDLALRSLWLEKQLSVNANLFYVDYSDMQLRFSPDPLVPFVRFIENAGEAEIYGLELETEYKINEGISLYASLALTESELQDFLFQGSDLSGQAFPLTSDISLSFGGRYEWGSGFSLSIDNIYNSDFYSTLADPQNSQVSSYFITNTRFGYEFDNWSLYGFVSNMFDREYVTTWFLNTDAPEESAATLGQPRTAGVTLEYSF